MPVRKDRLTTTPDTGRRKLATVSEVAEYLDVPVQTIYAWNSRGIGPRAIKVGRHLRYRWAEVDRWLDAGGHKGNTG